MPSRVLREGILDSRAVNSLSIEAELFYWRLLLVVDDYGRHEADPELLSVKCFPRRWRTYDGQMTDRCLTEASAVLTDDGHPLVLLYQVGNRKYLQISNFNQRIRAEKSKCPSPDGHMPVTCLTDDGPLPASRARAQSESYSKSYSNTESKAKSGEYDPNPGWLRFEQEYPGEVIPDRDCRVWLSVITNQQDEEMLWRNLPSWSASRKWQDGFIPSVQNFLFDGHWKVPPKAETVRAHKSRLDELMEGI